MRWELCTLAFPHDDYQYRGSGGTHHVLHAIFEQPRFDTEMRVLGYINVVYKCILPTTRRPVWGTSYVD